MTEVQDSGGRPLADAAPQQDIPGKQRAEEHGLGGEKQPHTETDVCRPGIGPCSKTPRNSVHAGSVCETKSRSPLSTPYSYAPRNTCGSTTKFPGGGGELACHSSVVPPHGLSIVSRPRFQLNTRLTTKGSWKRPKATADHVCHWCQWSAGCA